MNIAVWKWNLLIQIGVILLIFRFGHGVKLPPEWSIIQELFKGIKNSELYPHNEKDVGSARNFLYGRHFGGDILLKQDAPSDASIKDIGFRWPGFPGNGTIPYVIHKSLRKQRKKIRQAMQQYHTSTCIRFVKRKRQDDYIRLITGSGCSSFVGRLGGMQDVTLGNGCWYVGTFVHELGHAVGLYHEHQRSDRDKYITVHAENIARGRAHDFSKIPVTEEIINTEFSYSSIMMYGNYAFSKQPGVLKTMDAKNPDIVLKDPFEKPGLTNLDIVEVNKLYECK